MKKSRIILSTILVLGLLVGNLAAQAQKPSGAPPAPAAHDIELVGKLGGEMEDLFVQGDYAYVGEGTHLTILDISDPTAPTVLGSTASWLIPVLRVYVSGDYAYVATGDWGSADLRIVDVSNPAAPVEVGFYADGGPVGAVVGHIAYAGLGGRLRVLDVSDPTQPTQIGYYRSATCGQGAVTAVGDRAYIACQELVVLDVSDPTRPQPLGSVGGLIAPTGIALSPDGNTAYVSDYAYGGGLWVLDVSDPSDPAFIGHPSILSGYDVAVAGDRVYFGYTDGLYVLDVSDPTAPLLIGYKGLDDALGVAVVGDYAYLAAGWQGLRVLDVSLVDIPRKIGLLEATWSSDGDMAVQDSHVYIAAKYDGLQVVDVSNPITPTVAGAYTPPDTSILDVVVEGAYAYATIYDGQRRRLQIIDISDPGSPALAGSYTPTGDSHITIEAVAVGGGYAYVATHNTYTNYNDLRVVDVSDPANPTEVASYTDSSAIYALTLAGNYLYLTGSRTMDVVDISDPTDPVLVGSLGPSWYGKSIVVSGSYAYISSTNWSRPAGLRVIDVSDPANPTEVSFCSECYGAQAVVGNTLYGGSDVTDISNPASPIPVYFDDDGWDIRAAAGDYAYAFPPDGGLGVLDISHVGAPREAAAYVPPAQSWEVAVAGEYAYVADGWNGLAAVDVSDPAAPALVGGFYDQEMGGEARAVAVSGDVAYLAQSWLHLLDVTNPAAPSELGRYSSGRPASDVVVSDDTAYVATTDTGLRIVDVSNPAAPAELGFYQIYPYWASAASVALAGTLAGIGGDDLLVMDVSDPTMPTLVGADDLRLADLASSTRLDTLYAAAGEAGLAVMQVSAVTSPTLLSSFGSHLNAGDVTVTPDGNYAYVTNETYDDDRLQIIDISDPHAPQLVGLYDGAESVREVAIAGGYAYAAARDEGLQIWDISNPADPFTIGVYDDPGPPSWSVVQVAVAGDYAYLYSSSSAGDQMTVVDVSNPAAPVQVGAYPVAGFISDLAVSGHYAYVAASGGLRIVDVSDPTDPVEVGHYQYSLDARVAVSGSTVYLALGSSLLIIDASDPTAPVKVGSYTEPYRAVGSLAQAGNRVYLGLEESTGESWGGLRVVDVTDPANPTPLGAYDLPGGYDKNPVGAAVQGGYVYLAAEEAGLRVVDVADPATPTETGFYLAAGAAQSVAALGDQVYVGDDAGGLRLVDVSDPSAPRQTGFYELPAPISGLAATCEFIYAAADWDGLYILRDTQAACYTISGRVTDAAGQPLAGVRITANGTFSATTNADGQYTLADLSPGSYTLAPDKDGFFFSPDLRAVTVPPDMGGQDFVGGHLRKESAVSTLQVVGYGQPLTYTLHLVYPDARQVAIYDALPAHTTYISGSLHGPAGVVYDAGAGAISGTLSLAANAPLSLTFAVRVGISGTAESHPDIVNQACVYPVGGSLADCEWSDKVRHRTYGGAIFLPLVLRQAAP